MHRVVHLAVPLALLAAPAAAPAPPSWPVPASSPASAAAEAAPAADVGRALREEPPLPGEPTAGWPGLEEEDEDTASAAETGTPDAARAHHGGRPHAH
ncbi:MAG: hypothetical protein ACK4N5_27715 [Myxococcales bacterium]